jgi:hypothetical protein
MIICRKDAKAQRKAQENKNTENLCVFAPLRQTILFREFLEKP